MMLGTPIGYFLDAVWYQEVFRDKGHDCGECGRLLKLYHRKLSRSMARGLVRLYRLELTNPGKKFFHVRAFDKEGGRGEFGVVSKWGLAELQNSDTKDKKSSGFWALTEFGRRFVLEKESIPEYVILGWGSRLHGFAGAQIAIRHALERSNVFSYEELMSWTPEPEHADE